MTTNQSECDPSASTPRDQRPVSNCGLTEPSFLTVNVSWSGRSQRPYAMKIRTGVFNPSFAWGTGISATATTGDDNSGYSFVLEGFIDDVYSVNFPRRLTDPPLAVDHQQQIRDFLASATAETLSHRSVVRIYPKSYWRIPAPNSRSSPGSISECVDIPMYGLWAEANAQMFAYGYSWNGKTAQASVKFNFEARGPHFLPGSTDAFVPARIRVFLPAAYLSSLGLTVANFTESLLKVTTAQGEVKAPVIERRSNGVVVNFGISHYSAPDPTLEVFNPDWTSEASALTTTTSSSVASVVAAPTSTSKTLNVKVKKTTSRSRVLAFAGLSPRRGETVRMQVLGSSTRVCRVQGAAVRGLKRGTCRLKISLQKSGKTRTSKTVSLKIV